MQSAKLEICMEKLESALDTELNYSMLSWAILCNILQLADVQAPNNRAASAKDIPHSLTNRSAISARTRGILPRRLP